MCGWMTCRKFLSEFYSTSDMIYDLKFYLLDISHNVMLKMNEIQALNDFSAKLVYAIKWLFFDVSYETNILFENTKWTW